MKFFISIIMVLLMLNLFAQADVAADPENATGIKVDDSVTKKVVTPGDAYERTVTGIPADGNQGVQGQQKPCEKTDANGKCVPMPNKSTVANKRGTYVIGSDGKPRKISPAKPAEVTK
jgi:hypothetical protein